MTVRRQLWRALGSLGDAAMSAIGYPDRLTILIFHSVGPSEDPLGYWDTTEQRFELTAQVLKHAFNVIPLADAVRHLAEGTLPTRAACITFDDGYADNYTVALPILQRHGLCATFFVASAFLDGGRMFNDIVIETIRRCESDSLDLSALGFGVIDLATVAARAAARQPLLAKIKSLPLEQREETVSRIAAAAGVSSAIDLMMTTEQVAGLAAAGMEVGAHTHRHPILTSVSDDEVRDELATSKQVLQDITGRSVRLFAYPNGRPEYDYALRHAKMVREVGFDAAVSTARGAATYGADRYQLPRFTPWDRVPEKIIARLMLNWREDFQVAQ